MSAEERGEEVVNKCERKGIRNMSKGLSLSLAEDMDFRPSFTPNDTSFDQQICGDNRDEVFLPLMSTPINPIISKQHNQRPNSILKNSTQHKRSCSTGQQIRLPLDSTSDSTTKEKLISNSGNYRTKSVQILTPSQEKDESELWQSTEQSTDGHNTKDCELKGQDNNKHQYCTKYCAKCDKLLTNFGFDYTTNCQKSDQTSDEFNTRCCNCYHCSGGDCDIEASNTGPLNCHNCSQYQCRQRNQSTVGSDNLSLYSIHMEKDFRYYFQHPYARLFVAYFVVFCNFLIFAEDPLSHSLMECSIPVLGNVISFVATKYPPEWQWTVVKVSLWLCAIFVGLVFGKYILHHIILRRMLRLKMFRDECGTWMIMFATVFISCYFFSIVYNFLLVWAHPRAHLYVINTYMGMTYANFMKVAACGTWLGDFFTAWMITDMMLQDNLYPGWAQTLRSFWHKHTNIRIFVFWSGAIVIAALVITLIVTDKISWDNLNRDFIASTELSRAFLASSILCMDLLIVMQDWDFPHFVCDLNIKLPGFLQSSYTLEFFKKSLKFPEMVFNITGKWFNYGIIVGVMMLDLNMWKNQIIYFPPDYGQYVDPKYHKVYTVLDAELLSTGNRSLWEYTTRALHINPLTNQTYIDHDLVINSRYLGYPAFIKAMAFLPIAAGFILFFTLIYQYGRFPPKTDVSVGGRLKKRHSSWRRERRDSRLGGYISWRGITIYGGNTALRSKSESIY